MEEFLWQSPVALRFQRLAQERWLLQ